MDREMKERQLNIAWSLIKPTVQTGKKEKAREVTKSLRNSAINQDWKRPVPDEFLLSVASKKTQR